MPERELELDPEHTALVVIDLQKGIVGMPAAPYDTAAVVAMSRRVWRSRLIDEVNLSCRPGTTSSGAVSIGQHPTACAFREKGPGEWVRHRWMEVAVR
ncbi:MAG: hypothetical protein ACYCTZ_14065 [Candidatus Dormibacteria bacterium]